MAGHFHEVNMIGYIIILFVFVTISDCTVDNQGILLQISSGENVCNDDKLFRNFKLSDTTEFGAMCNVPFPNEKQVDFLLQNNVVPILCMGVYDISIRLCNEAANDTSYFKEFFPPSPEKFTGIFDTLKKTEEYSDLKKFCTETVKKIKLPKSSNNITTFWWQVLSNNFNNEKNCSAICRTLEINQVHPLCSYVSWSNDRIHDHQSRPSLAESNAIESEDPIESLDKAVKQSDSAIKLEVDPVQLDEVIRDVIRPSVDEEKTVDESVIKIPHIQSEDLNFNSTKQAKENDSNKDVLPHFGNKESKMTATVTDTANSNLDKISNSNSTGTNVHVNKNNTKKVEGKQNVNNKSLVNEKNLTIPVGHVDDHSKTEVDNKDQTKTIDFAEDQNDFGDEFNLDSVPSDPPVGSNPETQQQIEDEVEEDVEEKVNVVETPEKATSKGNEDDVHKINAHTNKQVKPDEVYSEGNVVVIQDPFIEVEDTHFFSYFLFMSVLTIVAYLVFHNKNKLLALAVEGRRSKSSRRRPNSSNYSKLDCSLEEAMVSNTTASVTHVLY